MIELFDILLYFKDYEICTPVCRMVLKPTPKIFGVPHMKWSLGKCHVGFPTNGNSAFYIPCILIGQMQ